jgi:hypothetical protein
MHDAELIDPTDWCRCDSPDNEAWSDLCKTCKRLVEPYQADEDTYGPGWPE